MLLVWSHGPVDKVILSPWQQLELFTAVKPEAIKNNYLSAWMYLLSMVMSLCCVKLTDFTQ